jgi:hypothetical protein
MKYASRVVVLALGAALALCALGTGSALASECPGTGTGLELCSEGHALTGTFEFTGKGGPAIAGIESIGTWNCATTTSKGKFVAAVGTVEVAGQTMEWHCALSGCKFNPLRFGTGTGGLHGAWGSKGEYDQITLAAASGSPFGELSITECEQERNNKITGEQSCQLRNPKVEATSHTVECLASGGALKAGTKRFTMEGSETVSLASGKAFSLQQG